MTEKPVESTPSANCECCPEDYFRPCPKPPKRVVLSKHKYKALCEHIHTRDGWKCRASRCNRRSGLHAHHIIYRSQGGGDTTDNVITVCNVCHDAIHRGRLKILPPYEGQPINADEGVIWKWQQSG